MGCKNSCCPTSLGAITVLRKLKICSSCSMLLWVIVVSSLQQLVQCQDVGDYSEYNPSLLPFITQVINSRISNLSSLLSRDISKRSSFCVRDPDTDWNQAFNFSSNTEFLAACIKKTKGT
uniref:Protein white n=1 Tax=Rhizophora mucronata TaxID=61149 RepID=A0A2P2ILD6_RHIMU